MIAEADQVGPARALPSVSAYLTSVFEVGRRSLRPAVPVLAFFFLCRLGAGVYEALRAQGAGMRAGEARMAFDAAIFLFLVLISTPLLPLQESLLREQPIQVLAAIRRVLGVSANLMLSVIVQVLILLSPLSPFLIPPSPAMGLWWTFVWDHLGLVMWAFIGWLPVATLSIIFATPAVVLDREGPLRSLRTSCRLMWGNLGNALGRLLPLAAFLAFVAYMIAMIPSWILRTPMGTSGVAPVPIKLAAVIWTSAADTVFLPFWVATVVVLYRSLRDLLHADDLLHLRGPSDLEP